MTLYETFCALPIRHDVIGFDPHEEKIPYFCTPKNAEILGYSGVDGIHYCTVGGFGELIFAVMPMNPPGDYVRPIARSFPDLMKLLLACGDMAAIDQAYFMNHYAFKKFIKDNPPCKQAVEALRVISDELCLVPMDEPFAYIKTLQEEFDDNALAFTEDYAMMVSEDPPAEEMFSVSFDGSFFGSRGKDTEEAHLFPLNKRFHWCGKDMNIPNLYLFSQGIVLDLIAAVDPQDYKAFLQDHLEAIKNGKAITEEQQEQITSENPLNLDFEAHLTINGVPMRRSHSSSVSHIAPCLRREWFECDDTGSSIIRHYDLSEDCCYSVHRISFPWPDGNKPKKIDTLSIRLIHEPMMYPSIHLIDPQIGDIYPLKHPFSGQDHILTVLDIRKGQMDAALFSDREMEFPTRYTAMQYTVEPPLDRNTLQITDCKNGDSPRSKTSDPENPLSPKTVASAAIGIIGGADGPTGVLIGRTANTAISSLSFEDKPIEWRLRFYIKLHGDGEFTLIG